MKCKKGLGIVLSDERQIRCKMFLFRISFRKRNGENMSRN